MTERRRAAECHEQDPIDFLVSCQHPDGGWGYEGTVSWTEPTSLALLALSARGMIGESFAHGSRWLAGIQREDGGWPPQAAVAESAWVTALAVAVPATIPPLNAGQSRAMAWLMRQTGEESKLWRRAVRVLFGKQFEFGEGTVGWPYFPGTATWVMPTALTVLALEKCVRRTGDGAARKRVEQGRECLLARTCRDGGWNYGTPRALGVDADSYPETTGAALLGLHATRGLKIDQAVAAAEAHMKNCRSVQGRCWLALGLAAHGRNPGPIQAPGLRCRNATDAALLILAEAAAKGRNPFVEEGA
jgi:squalene cyclase